MVTSFGLGTFAREAEDRFPGLAVGDQVRDLRDVAGSVRELLRHWDEILPVLRRFATEPGPWQALEGLRICAPVEPGQVIQAGANYRTHVIDLAVRHARDRDADEVRAETAQMMDRRAASGEPYLFVGLPSAVTGPYDNVTLPAYSDQHDWELELAVVIGREAFRVDRVRALDHIAGYTIANDITTRDLVFRQDMPEIGADWFRSKNAPGFTPLGPWLVPLEFVEENPRITLRLNGDVMQDESTKDMIFDVAALVSAASHTTQLRPGDVVLTGSPAGNGFHHGRMLRAGDVMEGTITGLGTQRTRCVAP